LVQEALTRLTEGRTTLIVAHRFSSIRQATRVVVLQGGKIVEQGAPEELFRHGGQFHRLASLQGMELD
jgi:ABC-type multidrug transport system fused ATPase/permease subunit